MNLVIGLGKVFWEYYYPNINQNNYIFYDENTIDLPDSLSYTNNFNEILDSNYKCIYILTPPNTRSNIIDALYSNTNSFYIEKPVFSSLEEYKNSKSIVNGTYLLGGHSRRFFNNYIHLRNKLIDVTDTSRIINISVTEGSIYKWNPKKLELITNDELSHLIDSLLYILDYSDKDTDYEVKKVVGDNISNLYIECILNGINIDINFSRNTNLLNQIRIDFDNNTSYLLNTKLNGTMQSLSNNHLSEISSEYQKQSSVSVFNEIINHVEDDSFMKDNDYKLLNFENTLTLIDCIKRSIEQ